jgi:predicted RND superfamily exporter protein
MCMIESKVANHPLFPDFCHLEADGVTCSDATMSLPLMYYGYAHDWSCPLLAEVDVTATTKVMIDALQTEAGILQYGFFFGKETAVKGYATVARSILQLGAPLEGFETASTDISTQYPLYEGFFGTVESDLWDYFGKVNSDSKSAYTGDMHKGDLQVRYWGFDIQQLEFIRIVETDIFYSLFSIIFVYFWIIMHSGSLFMATIGMLQIVCSLPLGNGIYKGILGIDYFDTLHTLVIFLVLGIGADDVFVLFDGWKQTAHTVPRLDGQSDAQHLHARMIVAYSRTFYAVFNTSFTTAMAFVATAISPIMPISTFGIYAAICIVINYFMVIMITPTAVLFHHVYVRKWEAKIWRVVSCKAFRGAANVEEQVETVKSADNVAGEPILDRTGIVDKFFDILYVPFMSYEINGYKVCALVCIIVATAFGVTAATFSFQLTPPTEQEQWFPADHMFTGILDDNSYLFLGGSNDQYVPTTFNLGIEGVDRNDNPSGVKYDIYQPSINRGTTIFDADFDFTNSETQDDFLTLCAALRTQECNAIGCSLGKLIRPDTVVCFLEEFDAWLISDKAGTLRSSLTGDQFLALLVEFRRDTVPSNSIVSLSWQKHIGFIDGELKYVQIPAYTTMFTLLPLEEKKSVARVLEDMIDKLEDEFTSKETTGKILNEAGIAWTWMVTEEGLVTSLFQGFAICFPVAFLVLLLATKNVIVSAYAILSIGFIVSAVMGLIQRMGWSLGVAESVAGIIVIGFSVDYVVHLAHMYQEGYEHGKVTSVDRFRYSCTHMGGTIVAGAITTAGSGSFMFMCQLAFFFKMAMLIVSTILFSLAYSLLLFMPLLMLFGPNTTFGDLSTMGLGKARVTK